MLLAIVSPTDGGIGKSAADELLSRISHGALRPKAGMRLARYLAYHAGSYTKKSIQKHTLRMRLSAGIICSGPSPRSRKMRPAAQ